VLCTVATLFGCSSDPGIAQTGLPTRDSLTAVVTTIASTPTVLLPPETTVAQPVRRYPLGGTALVKGPGDTGILGMLSDGSALTVGVNNLTGECTKELKTISSSGQPVVLVERDSTLCPNTSRTDGRYVVWEEDSGDFVRPDWTIWSYEIASRELRQIASWSSFGTTVVAQGGRQIEPYVDDGLIVWSATVGEPPRSALFTALADGSGSVKELNSAASSARYAAPFVAFADVSNPIEPILSVLNIESGSIVELGQLPSSGNIGFTGELIVVTSEAGVELIEVSTTVRNVLDTNPSAQWPEASRTLIGWYTNEHSYVYNTKTEVITELGTRAGANDVWITDNHVGWLEDQDESLEAQASTWDLVSAAVAAQ
jgi:hypothetical protein